MFLDRRVMSYHITGYRVGHDQADCLDRHGSLHTWRRHFLVAHEHFLSSSFLHYMYLRASSSSPPIFTSPLRVVRLPNPRFADIGV